MPFKCFLRGHDWKTVKTANLKPKPDGALKLTLDNFDVCDLSEATYFATWMRCERCGKETIEIQ